MLDILLDLIVYHIPLAFQLKSFEKIDKTLEQAEYIPKLTYRKYCLMPQRTALYLNEMLNNITLFQVQITRKYGVLQLWFKMQSKVFCVHKFPASSLVSVLFLLEVTNVKWRLCANINSDFFYIHWTLHDSRPSSPPPRTPSPWFSVPFCFSFIFLICIIHEFRVWLSTGF